MEADDKLMNETMKACVALVDTLSPILSLGPRERNMFLMNETMQACVALMDTLSPILLWVTVCPPVQHMLLLFHSSNMFLVLRPSQYGPGHLRV